MQGWARQLLQQRCAAWDPVLPAGPTPSPTFHLMVACAAGSQAMRGFLDPRSVACARLACKALHAALPTPSHLTLAASGLWGMKPKWDKALHAVAARATSVELLVNLQLRPNEESYEEFFG
jgi:hypothetical protein